MASSAMITVPTTASRFALLQIDSDSDSDASEPGKQGKSGATPGSGGKGAQGSDKKKDKKKKKKEQQQSEANELRNLAFKKIPQKSCAPPPCMTLSGIASELLTPASGEQSIPAEGWQQWKQRDEQITTELYEADLEKALILSKLEYELLDRCGNVFRRTERKSGCLRFKPVCSCLYSRLSHLNASPTRYFSHHLPLQVKYKEVKARNAQLLKMLQQGEMKDKAEILLQVEELLHIKEELSSQVTLLHAALEQERSKVKGLQSEQPKHQGGGKKDKKKNQQAKEKKTVSLQDFQAEGTAGRRNGGSLAKSFHLGSIAI
uniref:G kinase anchoring protein 1 n=1 Tax=Fundulus heteroclitus TaxID=8078 RepID=A0A3Q2TUC3_FUNHE